MYIGIDFLIDKGRDLYLSEINTGVPAGAFEYDLVHSQQFGRPSGVFDRIEEISKENFSLPFKKYIKSLPFIEDLKALKIWMDGRGGFPVDPAPELRLEDKWVQYGLLSPSAAMLPTAIYGIDNKSFIAKYYPEYTKFVLKRRLGRNGRGFKVISREEAEGDTVKPEGSYIIQPWIDSSIKGFALSIRAAAFCGHFICMFASLSPGKVSNHGYRFYIEPGEYLGLSNQAFKLEEVVKRSWEAEILFGDDLPEYLKKNVMLETISDGRLSIPRDIYEKIKKVSSLVNNIIMETDLERLSCLADKNL